MTKQDQIAEAAFGLFAERGYADVRMEDVAERAGVAKGTVYLHFPSKDELFRGVVTRKLAPATEALGELLAADHEVGEAALRAFYARVGVFVDSDVPGILLRLIIAESARFPELLEIHYRSVIQPMSERLGALMQRGSAAGAFREGALGQYPQLLLAPALMAALWRLLLRAQAPLDTQAFLTTFADLAVHGIQARGDDG